MTAPTIRPTEKVAFIYHFFPHYRYGVVRALTQRLDAAFVGDRKGAEGIAPYIFDHGEEFHAARCYYLGKLAFQPAVVGYCLRARRDVFVFLASPNHVSTWIGALIARLRGKRVVFWGHGFKYARRDLKNRVRKLFFSLAHDFYAYGWRAKRNAMALGADPGRIHVGFNSLNYDAQLPLRQALLGGNQAGHRDGSVLRIFCISRLTRICRYDMLLDAAAQLAGKGIRSRVVFVGDGPEGEALERQARDLGVDVEFHGAIYDESRIAGLVFDADVTVSPGKVGLTAMHSLMFGTPVITHDDFESQMPEVEAIVPGFTGELFRAGSVSDLADKLATFPARFPDRRLTRERCFTMIDRLYNPDKQAEVMLRAVCGLPAATGDDAFTLFAREQA
ncbi:hypothetical protein DSC_07585 [Pseudoxanthomonas spadix BD-a59]|uniref:Uncharacterized protein n=1 Tax=Pseudoxanthomonas spadix (strain BD-a59) TaxID=1045855 RepID=G7UTR5_PSEUP|nr:glycosyltransferase family 4 protein [Pseudoxanthomonas spadix]AER56168.1 hypothetical protein DSC_07585 [Pseudoxanthomonas spadix BD-a59]